MNGTTLNLLQITDTHIFADTGALLGRMDTRASFCRVLDAARRDGQSADAILLTGDLAAEGEASAYSWLIEQLSIFEVPIYCIPGNHDVATHIAQAAARGGWGLNGNHMIGNWHIVLLDSTVVDEAYGRLGDAELERLSAVLFQHSGSPTVIVMHHHPVPMVSRWMDTMALRNADAFWSEVERHAQVQAVVCGHVHQNYDCFRNSVRVLATPSTCVQFAPRAKNFAIDALAPGYRRLRLSSDGEIDTEVVRTGAHRLNSAT